MGRPARRCFARDPIGGALERYPGASGMRQSNLASRAGGVLNLFSGESLGKTLVKLNLGDA